MGRAWRLIAEAHYLGRRAGPSVEASEQALVHVRRAGDRLEEAEIVEYLAVALMRGPTAAPDAIRRVEQLVEEVAGNPVPELIATGSLANLLALTGRPEEARELMERARRVRDERLGKTWFWPDEYGPNSLFSGDPIAAGNELRRGYELQRRVGGTNYLSTISAYLARALFAQGRDGEAERLTQECEEATRPNDVQANIIWRATRALVLARRGELGPAEALAGEAVAFAADSDFLESHADALVDLAEVRRLAGRPGRRPRRARAGARALRPEGPRGLGRQGARPSRRAAHRTFTELVGASTCGSAPARPPGGPRTVRR